MRIRIWWERHCARVLSRHNASDRVVNAFVGSVNVGQFQGGEEV